MIPSHLFLKIILEKGCIIIRKVEVLECPAFQDLLYDRLVLKVLCHPCFVYPHVRSGL